MVEQIQIIKRIAKKGLKFALEKDPAFVDTFQHLIDEIETLEKEIKRNQKK